MHIIESMMCILSTVVCRGRLRRVVAIVVTASSRKPKAQTEEKNKD